MLAYNLNFLVASSVFVCLTLFGLFNVLLFLRKKFPIRVNCWFCNTNLRVPYNEWNSFTCPKCQQYNGFNEDGSYNKEIPEQYHSKLNTNQFCQRKYIGRIPVNGFCEFCTRNQELKVHQLANFRPRYEEKYDEEVEEFRQKLEDSYQLCHSCQSHLNKTLNKIKTKFIGSKLSQLNAKFNRSLNKTARIIVDDGKVLSYVISTILLLLSIANFTRDMKIELPSINDERALNVINHLQVFLYTVLDVVSNWTKEIKFNELFENADIDRIATSALILNAILIFNDVKKVRLPVMTSMLLWSVKMMTSELHINPSYEPTVNGIMAAFLIVSSLFMFKEKKPEKLNVTSNSSFHKIPTECYEDSDNELDLSETSSFFDHRSNITAYSKCSRLSSSFRSPYVEPIKALNSTMRPSPTQPLDISSNKSFSITKEVLTADRNQVQNDITRLKLTEKGDKLFSTSSTIKELNSNPFSLERSRCDSPAPSVASLFSTSTRTHLISPPRLNSPTVYAANTNQSWIGGGYWTSPQKKYLNGVMNQSKPVISRSSSQSSGVGTIDESDKNSREESMTHEEAPSIFSDAASSQHRRSLFEMPQNRSLFTANQFFNHQPKNHHSLFNNTYNNNSSFRKYRETNAFFK